MQENVKSLNELLRDNGDKNKKISEKNIEKNTTKNDFFL